MGGAPRRTVVVGAAGRDFHNFNVVLRDDPSIEMVAFTAAQIPGIAGRRYPPSLAGPRYPQGIPIVAEDDFDALCRRERVELVVFSYSDVPHEAVMHLASRALAAGADFSLLGPGRTMLRSRRPVIAVSAVRTGCGKSQVARKIAALLREHGRRVAVVRHPMPYGDLERQRCQRFAGMADLTAANCTNEEREEYEPHLAAGQVVFAGVDYAAVLAAAEQEADIIVWDGGNNDFPFFQPDLHFCLVDTLRPGQIDTHHPGEAALRMAHVAILNKVNAATPEAVERAEAAVRRVNPNAAVLRAASVVTMDDMSAIRGRRVIVVEDGPTITHGGAPHGAGLAAARSAGAVIVDPRASATPAIRRIYDRYPHIGPVLPSVGYDAAELRALTDTLNAADADAVLSATPLDLAAIVSINKPILRVRYDYADAGEPTIGRLIGEFLQRQGIG